MQPITMAENAKWLICPKARPFLKNGAIGFQWYMDVRHQQFEAPVNYGGLSMFRRIFFGKGVRSCHVTATALGVYELYCNGHRVGTQIDGEWIYDELKPGWTDYHKRVFCDTYDLMPFIQDGENVLFAVVAPGWWSGRIGNDEYGTQAVSFCACITLDGVLGKEKIVTNEEWQSLYGGPIRSSDIWDGEIVENLGEGYEELSLPGDKEPWGDVIIAEHSEIRFENRIGPQIRIRKGMDVPVVKTTLYNGIDYDGSDYGRIHIAWWAKGDFTPCTLHRGETLLLDFGQEVVGWPVGTMCAKKGTKITYKYGEFLNDSGLISRGNDNPKGSIYSINYRTAKAKGYYTFGGKGDETYCPMFTFYGYRYVELTATDDVEIKSMVAKIVGSDVTETGTLETSNPLVNRLIQNIIWGQRSNYLSVPTDCPQRDERLGWTGDTQIFCNTAAYNGDVRGFFHKWMGDCRDSQQEDGAYTDIIPHEKISGIGAAAWADVGIIVPYVLYRMYNDIDLLKEHYDSMEKYMSFVHANDGPLARYNDWVCFEDLDRGIIPYAYYGLDAEMMQVMSKALGKEERSAFYQTEYDRAKSLFRAKYVNQNGNVGMAPTSQCGYLMALKAGFLEGEEKISAIATLRQKIVDNGYRLSTGFVGTGVLNQTLSEIGLDDLAYSLLLQEECPSWLYSVKQGATTMWERWNSYTLATGFGDVVMNSFNHYAYGAIGEWMYRFMCGIEVDPNAPGFSHILLQPRPDLRKESDMPKGQEHITYAKATFNAVSGHIESSWKMDNGRLYYACTIPVGATLTLPSLNHQSYLMNGQVMESNGDKIILELTAGTYTFEV